MSSRVWRNAACLLLGAALVGCASGPAPRDHFYRLTAPAPEPFETPLAGIVEVERFSSSDVLRERGLLRTSPGSPEVTPYGYHRWVDSPTLLVQRALASYLRDARLAEQVVTPDAGALEDWQVNGHLAALDHVVGASPAVRVEIELRARRRGDAALLVHRTYAAERATSDASPQAAARAFSLVMGEIFASFARDLYAAGSP